MPELQDMFVALHRRRTKGEPRIPVGRGGPKELGRKDNYVSSYAGREYFKTEEPFEVMTMGIQQIFYPVWGWEYLDMMLRDDPEMLDLLLGLLFGYDP